MPTRYRDALKSTPGSLRITRHPDNCLLIFPLPAWERFRGSFGETALEDTLRLTLQADGQRLVRAEALNFSFEIDLDDL